MFQIYPTTLKHLPGFWVVLAISLFLTCVLTCPFCSCSNSKNGCAILVTQKSLHGRKEKTEQFSILYMSKMCRGSFRNLLSSCLVQRDKETAINVVVLFTTTVKIYKGLSSVRVATMKRNCIVCERGSSKRAFVR